MEKFVILLFMMALALPILAQEATEEPTQEPQAVTLRESAPDPAQVEIVEFATGFDNPLYVTPAGDGSGRLFVVEQAGKIKVLQDGAESVFLDLSSIVSQTILSGYSEQGLLGLAFHPNYAENGYFYVNYTHRNRGETQVARYSVSADDPNVADPDSAQLLLTLRQPYPNHNGGHLAFGPDGYLYISVGDGGAAADPLNTGQDPKDWYGSILRIDVDNGEPYGIPEDNPFADGAEGSPEVWAYGLRNAWRFSFDRANNDFYIADVGQNLWEEVNYVAADDASGANYGWDYFEASQPFESRQAPEGMIYPIAEYSHGDGCSVTGGYVYRGEVITDLQGVYLFSDYCSGLVWATYRNADGEWLTNIFKDMNTQVSSFGEDEDGELYIVGYQGTIYKVVAAE